MNEQQSLFTGAPTPPPAPSPIEVRNDAREAALEAADERWRQEYEAFILRYLETHVDGTGEDIRLAYEAAKLPANTGSKRASGGIFVRLRRAGKIRETGKRKSKIFGNDLTIYERTNGTNNEN